MARISRYRQVDGTILSSLKDCIIRAIRARKNRTRKNRAFACEDRIIRAIRARKNRARKNRAFACEDRIIRAVRA
jgi:hypothetical protein